MFEAIDTGTSRRRFLGGVAAGVALTLGPGSSFAAPTRGLAGVFPIGFTPVTPEDKVDNDGLVAQLKFLQRGGVQGLGWPQVASSWSVLSEAERMAGAEAMLDAAKGGRTAIVIGVQSRTNDFAETERYARHARDKGAAALICIPPTGASPDGLFAYYQRLAGVTDLPIMVQAVGDFSVDLLVRLAENIPNVLYVKDEAGDPLRRVGEIKQRTGGKLKSFSGSGVNSWIADLDAGFTGCCPFVSLSDLYASAYDLYRQGRKRDAFEQFARVTGASTLFAQSNINVMIARGVFKPGTKVRPAPHAPGTITKRMPAETPDEIARVIDAYLKPELRA